MQAGKVMWLCPKGSLGFKRRKIEVGMVHLNDWGEKP